MPGMNGGALARRLRAGRPDLPVLFVSGYSEASTVDLPLGERDTALLTKPFSPGSLGAAIRALLDHGAQPGA